MQILQTDLHSFPWSIGWENLFVYQSFSHQVIVLLILTTFSLVIELILFGENWLGPKGIYREGLSGKF